MRQVFPDVLETVLDCQYDHDDDIDGACVSELFFDLANAPEISFRVLRVGKNLVRSESNNTDDMYLVFRQDVSACGEHTGGIIWETAYLLLQYLTATMVGTKNSLGSVVELGAGVGFLGQCLAVVANCESMILTETAQVLENLRSNLDRNAAVLQRTTRTKVAAQVLDWNCYETDTAVPAEVADENRLLLRPHTIDTLLATDVLFAPHLVEPLLATAAHLSHAETIWYLCVQIRCAASHAQFLDRAPAYGFGVENITAQVLVTSGCEWGRALECLLFRITRLK